MKLIRKPDLSTEEGGEYVLNTEDSEGTCFSVFIGRPALSPSYSGLIN